MGSGHNRNLRRRILAWLCLAGLVLCCVLIPVQALARAGGGGGFSGGGGGGGGGFSGGSGGSGSGGGQLIVFLVRLAIRYPAVGVPTAIVVVVFFVMSTRAGHSGYVTRTIRRGYRAQDNGRIEDGLARLTARDPAFSMDAFLERCKTVFPTVQDAWAGQDMTRARHAISDGIHERFQLQLAMQRDSYVRNVMSDVTVTGVRAVGIHADSCFDTVHVEISASAVDYTIDTRNEKRVHGSKRSEAFTEIWSFLRRPGARTLQTPGLLEGFCPNCGTALRVNDSVQCGSCRALVNSGEFDWVLSEITQPDVWSDAPPAAVPGLDAFLAGDPAFNTQHVEDKASVVFWRLRAAEFFASDTYLRKLALPAFLERQARDFAPRDNGTHGFFADAAVGSVSVVGVEAAGGEDPEGMDRVHVHVKWSGHFEERPVPSLIRPDYGKSGFRSQDFVLVRCAGVSTSTHNTLTSAHCSGCGAPATVSTNGACEYCGLPQNDGSLDWVLEKVQPYFAFSTAQRSATEAVGSPLASRLSTGDSERLIQCAAAVMRADGEVDAKEQAALEDMATRRGISTERLAVLVAQVGEDGSVTAPTSGALPENREFLEALVVMCLADGKVTRAEQALIQSLVKHMRYTDVDISQMITRKRADLYQQSKQVLRAARGRSSR